MPIGDDEETAKNNPQENDHRQALVSSKKTDHSCRLRAGNASIDLELGETRGFAHAVRERSFAHLLAERLGVLVLGGVGCS